MLKENQKLIDQLQQLIDLLIVSWAFICAYFVKRNLLPEGYSGLPTGPNYYVVLLLIIIIWHVSLRWVAVYGRYREHGLHWFLIRILKASMFGMLLLNMVLFILHVTEVSRLLLAIFLILSVMGLTLLRWIVLFVLERIRSKGYNFRNVLVVGSKLRAKEVIEAIKTDPQSGYKVIGCLDPDPDSLGKQVSDGCQVMGQLDALRTILEEQVVDELIFAMPLGKIPGADLYITQADEMGVRVRIIPDWQLSHLVTALDIAHIRVDQCSGVHALTFQSTPINESLLAIKALTDFVFSVLFLILLLPLMGLISVAIFLSSPGPILYRQERMGQNGRRFELLKFRTMVIHADKMLDSLKSLNEADGPAFKIEKDPRIIPWVGTFLRKTSMDELPQLFNVFKGDMSLVGPRPPIPFEVDEYESWQRRRLSMKPGITCIWQITPRRNELSFEEWMRLDLEYIDQWSLWLDFILLVKTAKAVLTGAGR